MKLTASSSEYANSQQYVGSDPATEPALMLLQEFNAPVIQRRHHSQTITQQPPPVSASNTHIVMGGAVDVSKYDLMCGTAYIYISGDSNRSKEHEHHT